MTRELTLWPVFLLIAVAAGCSAQVNDVLCKEGSGSFETQFRTGVRVSVGPEKKDGFNTRECQGTLSWGKQTVVVASGVAQLDVDLLGAELEPGEAVVAFAEARSNADCCMTYKIYSLKAPPKLLRTISGGGYFRAADTDLDGGVEIWTEDTAAVNGFEGLSAAQIDFIPTYVLRMDHGRLLDASPEFQPFFDDVIKKVRSEIKPEPLGDFKTSDGRLEVKIGASVEQAVRMHELRLAKIQALEIVWAYLYSGREQEAWRTLAEMWPTQDAERIRGEILNARTRGIRSQLDGMSAGKSRKNRKGPIYEQTEVTPAQAILMRIYPPPEFADTTLGKGEVHVSLVVDSAGKVRAFTVLGATQKLEGLVVDPTRRMQAATPAGDAQGLQQFVATSVAGWKFVPAFKNDRAVASRMQTGVWLRR